MIYSAATDAAADRSMDDAAVEFFTVYPDTPAPQRASGDALGSMPVRAAQFCQPMREAGGTGFYIYPTADFALRWNGRITEATLLDEHGEEERWIELRAERELYTQLGRNVRDTVPEHRRADIDKVIPPHGYSMVNADPREPRQVEMIMGVIARTPPGYGLLVTAPANLRPRPELQVFEGFLETDWFRSFVPAIVRLNIPHAVVRFFRTEPLLQVRVLPIAAMTRTVPFSVTEGDWSAWPEDLWHEYVSMRSARLHAESPGVYQQLARRAAKTGRCPFRPT